MTDMNQDNKITIRNTRIDFSTYYESNNISEVTQSKIDSIDILAVPTAYANDEFYFAQETIDFIKYCRNNFPDNSFDVLAEEDMHSLIQQIHQ